MEEETLTMMNLCYSRRAAMRPGHAVDNATAARPRTDKPLCPSERDDRLAAARRAIFDELRPPRVDRGGQSTRDELLCALRQRHGLALTPREFRDAVRCRVFARGPRGWRLNNAAA